MNNLSRIAAAAALLCALPGCATTYDGDNAAGLFGGQGAKRIDPDSWRIEASSNGIARRDLARDMAIYKAAVVARATGFAYVQIYKFRIYQNQYGSQSADLRMHTVNDRDRPYACESRRFAVNCRVLAADEAIAYFGPLIGQTPEQTAAEVEALRQAHKL